MDRAKNNRLMPIDVSHIGADLFVPNLAEEPRATGLAVKGEEMRLKQSGVVASQPPDQRASVLSQPGGGVAAKMSKYSKSSGEMLCLPPSVS